MKMIQRLSNWLDRALLKESPSIYCLQVEVSTSCQLSCIYCPRSVLRHSWTDLFLDMNVYKQNILPHLDGFEMVFLQGWGEPLLHPQFWDMVYLAKQKGKKVGFATNGIALSDTAIQKACEIGVDVISFTFAGATAEIHEMYRKGASFQVLTDRVRMLTDAKQNLRAEALQIGISYTIMRRNLSELPQVMELAAKLGVNYVTASHMDFIPVDYLEEEAVFLKPHPNDEGILIKAAEEAAKWGIVFKSEWPRQRGELLVCEPHPFYTNVYITADGRVVPCHIMGLPLHSTNQIFFQGHTYPYKPLVIGAVSEQPLQVHLNSKVTQEVKEIFHSRMDATAVSMSGIKPVPEFCLSCYKLYGV